MTLQEILDNLSEESLERTIIRPHKEKDEQFSLEDDQVEVMADFTRIVNRYYDLLTERARLDDISRGIELVVKIYRQMDPLQAYLEDDSIYMQAAFEDAQNGHLPEIIGKMSAFILNHKLGMHIRYNILGRLFDWEEKCKIVEELFAREDYKPPPGVDRAKPSQYAQEYAWLIMKYVAEKK